MGSRSGGGGWLFLSVNRHQRFGQTIMVHARTWERMVQRDAAKELRRQGKQAGSPSCDHSELDREYYRGSQTGDHGCLTCGEDFSPHEGRRRVTRVSRHVSVQGRSRPGQRSRSFIA